MVKKNAKRKSEKKQRLPPLPQLNLLKISRGAIYGKLSRPTRHPSRPKETRGKKRGSTHPLVGTGSVITSYHLSKKLVIQPSVRFET